MSGGHRRHDADWKSLEVVESVPRQLVMGVIGAVAQPKVKVGGNVKSIDFRQRQSARGVCAHEERHSRWG